MRGRILLVDDSDMVIRLVAHTLKKAGYEVTPTNNGDEALAQLNGQDFDLLVTDLNMPVKDGITLIREMRHLDDYRFLPAMLFVNNPDENIAEYIHNQGATLLFSKNHLKDKLVITVDKLIS
ncbi:response regulator [Mucilaginibacter robiniae]|uniref:Response regulator n=1 Tax=Mucilaginibacter robiniae TaxID=2728022 RepID=A0A7L5E860_9SPHI|nr:response regulator [Mucilaginibacter robiniae]QJD96536.1 response regulator [Mucilaginibacter robiniae]